jgi:uncharacterized protein (TIGR00297 family)
MVERLAAGALIAGTIALIARWMRSLTWSGVFAGVLVGALSVTFGGYAIAVAIIIFFVSGSALGRIRNANADRARSFAAKGATRDAVQVIANGGVATVCAVAAGVLATAGRSDASAWVAAGVCAVAAASGDTWSTEIGAFSRTAPRRITDLRRVDAGTSGGVSLLGTSAAPLGGMLVGAAGLARPDLMAAASWLAAGAAAGLVGSLIDSVLGATVQGQWRCTACSRVQDARVHPGCDRPGELCRGVAWLDNDGVNALATVAGAVVGYFAASLARA